MRKKKKMQNLCKQCGTSENIVYSGVDAWILGCVNDTERICYKCATENNEEKEKENAKLVQ